MIKFSCFLLLLTFQISSAQLSSSEIDILASNAIKKFNVAGAAVAIVKDGKIVHQKGYGVSAINTGAKVNEHTQFEIASNSKAFTTTALALLVEEGKINWTDKVITHIPEFKMYNDYVTANFTIVDLLTHRSGMGLGIGDLMFFPDGADFTMKDLLGSFQHFKATSDFRTQFDYDNLLYLVAGEIIERKSGMTWENFIQQRIMRPIGMDQSYGGLSMISDKSNLAAPHADEKGKLRQLDNYSEMVNGAAGGILANVNDISNWMLLHLNNGKYGNNLEKQLFSKESQNEMWKIHTVMDVNRNPRYNSHFAGYGLGWFLEDRKGNMVVSHTGGLPGMLSITMMIPDLKFGVVVLTNTSDGGGAAMSAIAQTIADSYMGLEDFGWTDKYYARVMQNQAEGDAVTEKVWKKVTASAKEKVDTQNYIGFYEDKWFGKVEVFMKGNQLWFRSLRSPKLNGPMHFYNANTFAIKWEYQGMNADAFASFSLDKEGKAQSIKMEGISPNIDFSFDFHDLDLQRVTEPASKK